MPHLIKNYVQVEVSYKPSKTHKIPNNCQHSNNSHNLNRYKVWTQINQITFLMELLLLQEKTQL